MREVLQCSHCPLYLKNEYIYDPRVNVENRLKYQFSAFSSFLQRFLSRHSFFGGRDIFLVATQFFWSRLSFLVVTACLIATVSGQQLVFLLQLVGAITSLF